jgi:hypothetical protein
VNWLVTSPYGPQRTTSWSCFHCASGRSPGEPGAGEIRAEAAAHVESTGHQVLVYRGTSELLLPLATAPSEESPS